MSEVATSIYGRHLDPPFTAETVWAALRSAGLVARTVVDGVEGGEGARVDGTARGVPVMSIVVTSPIVRPRHRPCQVLPVPASAGSHYLYPPAATLGA